MDQFRGRNVPRIRLAEVRRHNKPDDCWMIIHGRVYDLKDILSTHPGGSRILLKYAGMDATLPFDDVGHSMESLIYDMPPGSLKGILDPRDRPLQDELEEDYGSQEEKDDELITRGHSQADNGYMLWNRLFNYILYFTIALCALVLLLVRFKWQPDLVDHIQTIGHLHNGALASPEPLQDPDEDGIPAWAY